MLSETTEKSPEVPKFSDSSASTAHKFLQYMP